MSKQHYSTTLNAISPCVAQHRDTCPYGGHAERTEWIEHAREQRANGEIPAAFSTQHGEKTITFNDDTNTYSIGSRTYDADSHEPVVSPHTLRSRSSREHTKAEKERREAWFSTPWSERKQRLTAWATGLATRLSEATSGAVRHLRLSWAAVTGSAAASGVASGSVLQRPQRVVVASTDTTTGTVTVTASESLRDADEPEARGLIAHELAHHVRGDRFHGSLFQALLGGFMGERLNWKSAPRYCLHAAA